MVDFLKKKIVEKLARFTKHLDPNDISLSFLKGKGELNNLDLNAEFITDVLRLPQWIKIKSVFCDQIKIDVPFTDLHKSPIKCLLHTVIIEVNTCDDMQEDERERADINLKKLSSSSPSSYGLTEKIIDGMKVEIGSVQVHFANPVFKGNLEMTDVIIESTTPEWQPDILPHCRYKNEDEGSVIIYKRCTWSSLKVEGGGIDDAGNRILIDPIRLMAGVTNIHVTVKRRLSDCKVLYTRVSVDLGDLSWVVTQEHLKTMSLLAQSLVEAAVKWNQEEREKMALMRGSRDSLDSIGSSGSIASSKDDDSRQSKKHKTSRKDTKNLKRETSVRNRELSYQLGQANLPAYEVIQDSIHIKSNSVNLQLCDGNGSLLMQVNGLIVDLYLDQLATTGRCHWNKANIKLEEAMEWSSTLVKTAEKIQFVDLPSINLYKLRERGIVVRCSDFSIKSEDKELLPIISCDNKTFSLPNNLDNPAFQFIITLYYYPLEEGHKFLVPRPNIYAYLSPIHLNIHQELFLWLAEFFHGVIRTVNLTLLLSARTEGKMFMEEIKAKRELVQQLPGIDAKFNIPYSKATLPLNYSYADNRPRAIQIETGGIHLENRSLLSILSNPEFISAWERYKSGWLSAAVDQFPNNSEDVSTPQILVDLIEKELKAQKMSEMQSLASSANRSSSTTHLEVPQRYHGRNFSGRRSAPDISHHKISLHQLNLLTLETWYCYTHCVSLSFVSDLSHEATLYGKEFVRDFPIQLWLFQPKKIAELLSPAQSPTSSSPQSDSVKSLSTLHVMLDIPQEVEVKLERLHFLFLMRLKDSFQGFKNRLMGYLTLDSLLEAQETEAFHIKKNDGELDSSGNDSGGELRDQLSAAFKDGMEMDSTSSSEKFGSLVTTGVNVQGIRVIISLPSLGPVLKSPKLGGPLIEPKGSMNKSCSVQTLPSQQGVLDPQTNASRRDQRTQSMPQLNVMHMQHTVLNKTERRSSASVSSNGTVEDFVYISHPPSSTSKSVSPTPMELIPEAIESLPDVMPNSDVSLRLSSPQPTTDKNSVQDMNTNGKEAKPESPKSLDVIESKIQNGGISMKSEMTEKPGLQIPFINEPKPSLVPTHSLYIKTGKLKVLLSLSDQGIALRTTVDTLHIDELTNAEISEIERKRTSKKDGEPVEDVACPVIKARIQLGKSVTKYFPNMEVPGIDGVAFLKVSGLKVVLGIKNLMAVKEFFDDEKESDSPLPIQLRIVETQLVIKDQLLFPLVHPKNVAVNIPDIFVNRGPRAHGTNLIQSELSDENEIENPPVVETVASDSRGDTDADLVESFHHFVNAFRTHTSQEGKVNISQREKVNQLLEELEKTLLSSPSNSDTLSCDFYSNVSSSSPHFTVDSLTAEVEAFRADNKKLQLELVNAQEQQTIITRERDEVTRDLVNAKVNLASAHLVIEQQLIKMEKLYTENCNMKDRLGE